MAWAREGDAAGRALGKALQYETYAWGDAASGGEAYAWKAQRQKARARDNPACASHPHDPLRFPRPKRRPAEYLFISNCIKE